MIISVSFSPFVYHITGLKEIEDIKLKGLEPLALKPNNYHGFYNKLVFYEWEHLSHWWKKLRKTIDIPVCLKTKLPLDAHPYPKAYLSSEKIDSSNIEFWNGMSWTKDPAVVKMEKEFFSFFDRKGYFNKLLFKPQTS